MALKSSREGLRKELVDYLGNIIIDENLKQNIINSVDDVFINNEELSTSANVLDEKIRNETLARENADTTLQGNINAEISARESADTNLESNKANKSDVLSLEEIQASTDLSGKIASASSLKSVDYKTNLYTYRWYGTENNYLKFTPSTFHRSPYFIFGDGNGNYFFGVFFIQDNSVSGFRISKDGNVEITGTVLDNVVTVNNATIEWSTTGMISVTPIIQLY